MLTFFNLLTREEKIKTLSNVERLFDRAHHFKTQFEHSIFQKKYPYEYKKTPIGSLVEKQALKTLTRRKHKISTIGFKKFIKKHKNIYNI